MQIVTSGWIWHITATIVMQSWIVWLLEAGNQMMISIHVSRERITWYYAIFYGNCEISVLLTRYCHNCPSKLNYRVTEGGESDDDIYSCVTWPDYVILFNILWKLLKLTCIWHTSAMIVIQSWIIGLLEVASQMMISIDLSHYRIT